MTRRIHSFDLLRLAAVLLVVVQHAAIFLPRAVLTAPAFAALDNMTRWNIPVLFLLSGFLSGWGESSRNDKVVDLGRVRRLLVPYACWGTIYTVVFGIQAYAQGIPIHYPDLVDVLTGQGVYFILWFLPMLAYCTLLAAVFRTSRSCLAGALACLIGWSALAPLLFGNQALPSYPASGEGFLVHLPFFLGCYLLAKWFSLSGVDQRPPALRLLTFLAGILFLVNSAWGLADPSPNGALPQALGLLLVAAMAVLLLLIALHFPTAGRRLSTFWRSAAPLGIYLTHMLVLEVLMRFIEIGRTPWFLGWLSLSAVGFIGAGVLVGLIIRVPLSRPALGLPASWRAQTELSEA